MSVYLSRLRFAAPVVARNQRIAALPRTDLVDLAVFLADLAGSTADRAPWVIRWLDAHDASNERDLP